MDFSDTLAQPEGLKAEGRKSEEVTSTTGIMSSTSSSHPESSLLEEDLMKEFDKKHSELSTFLQDIPPASDTSENKDFQQQQHHDSPLGDFPVTSSSGQSMGMGAQFSNLLGGDEDDPFGLNLGGSSFQDTSSKPDEIPFRKVNGKTESSDGGDAKLLHDLLDQANNMERDISPDSLLTDDLLNLDKSPAKSSTKDEQVVPPTTAHQKERDDFMSTNMMEQGDFMSTNLMEQEDFMSTNLMEHDSLLDRPSLSPMDLEEPKLPESPCFGPPSPTMTTVREESPKLPESPCFRPPSPEVTAVRHEDSQERPLIVDRSNVEPEIVTKAEPVLEEYTRRETKTFDNEAELMEPEPKSVVDKNAKNSQLEFEYGGGDLPSSGRNIITDQVEDEIPPPIPKHSWELEKNTPPPPVPPHSLTSDFPSGGFHSSHASNNFHLIHASYDDKIDDEFDEDSLSRPLSHRLSDSLEVLKESPQRDQLLDESLMDLDDLPSSSKNSVKSISPNDSKNILGDYSGADADISAPVTSLPSEMTESGLFSQQPPKDLDSDSLDIDEKFDLKQIPEEYSSIPPTTTATATTNKPIASITPFSTKGESMLGDAPLPSTMTSSMIMNTSLDEMQAPKFYESEDSSSKTDAPVDEAEKVQTEPDRNLELQEFEEAIPESMEESGTPASDSGSSKIEVLEIKPAVKEAEPEPVTKRAAQIEDKQQPEAKVIIPQQQPKQKIQMDTEEFELSEEMQLLLNTFRPRTWFDPSKLHPTVSELVYWRDPKKSGAVFGSIFIVLLALSLMSLISVVAYTSLAVLSGTFAFRVYKSVMQAVQKTQDGHPFKEYLDLDIAIPSDKAQELSNAIINYANSAILQLRRLFLVEDLVDSGKFGLVLYLLTYIGGWFNGLTLLILGFIALFALPKVYETNKTVIDQYLELINSKISEVTAKVTTAVPFLKKEKAQ